MGRARATVQAAAIAEARGADQPKEACGGASRSRRGRFWWLAPLDTSNSIIWHMRLEEVEKAYRQIYFLLCILVRVV